MSTLADDTRSLLLAVRLRPLAPAGVLATTLVSMALTVAGLERLLGLLELAGLVEHRGGEPLRWRLRDEGREEGERLLALEVDGLGVREGVERAYEGFLVWNGALLRACTDWQLRDADPASLVVNDHTDPVHDRHVMDRLAAVHAAVLPICADLTGLVGRFRVYGPRLRVAMDRIRAGDLRAVDGPDTDSYHAIWFELHDHLLATLGRDRGREPLPDTSWPPSSSTGG